MVTFSSSFRAILLSAVVLGLSANAAPSPGPGSPGSTTSSASSTGYSVETPDGICEANSASPQRFRNKEFLDKFPEFKNLGSGSSVNRRAGGDGFDAANRPDPRTTITLFHGTLPKYAAPLYNGIQIFPNPGDLSRNGGFYLTNSLRAAAQWGCHGKGQSVPQTAVFEFVWDGTQKDLKILSYGEEGLASDEEYKAFCAANYCPDTVRQPESIQQIEKEKYDMIAGPMMAVDSITSGFYQYGLLNIDKTKEPYLTRTGYHLLDCENFPKGEIETRDTQGPVAEFSDAEKKSVGLTGSNSFTKKPTWQGDDKIELGARPDMSA